MVLARILPSDREGQAMASTPGSGDVNPRDVIRGAARTAFQESLADGVDPKDALSAAANAATETATSLGISPEISGPMIKALQANLSDVLDSYDTAPQQQFVGSLAVGSSAFSTGAEEASSAAHEYQSEAEEYYRPTPEGDGVDVG